MLRTPIYHALRASRCRAAAAVPLEAAGLHVGRALAASSRTTSGRGDNADSVNSMLLLASVAAVGAASSEDANSQARADAPHANVSEPKTGDKKNASPSLSRLHLSFPGGIPSPSSSNPVSGISSSVKTRGVIDTSSATHTSPGPANVPAKGDSSPSSLPAARGGGKPTSPLGGGAGAAAGVGPAAADGAGAASGDGEEGGDKMGLQLSALFVHRALMEFRRERAATRVFAPPVDFREEQLGGGTTLSASFHLPRSANILRVLSALVTPDQVMEVKQPVLDKAGASISFCQKDRTGSLLVRQDASPGTNKDSIHLYRDGGFTKRDLEALVQGYQEAWSNSTGQDASYRFVIAPGGAAAGAGENGSPAAAAAGATPRAAMGSTAGPAAPGSKASGADKLRQLGVEVFDKSSGDTPGWDSLAGYADVKQEIEDTLILPLRHPEVYDVIARKTRSRFESNRPRAVLFEGPPGTGKTLSARIIAGRSDRPMVHVPVENIMSKWYGESEKRLSAVFEACDEMGGAIIFIDEADALAGSRSTGGMHEATRRVLSVILQKVEGFEKGSKNTLICATNRKTDLDAALVSRFQLCIKFGLPDLKTRREVYGLYAKQLKGGDLETLASISAGMSCRDIKETCQHAERRWASKIVRGKETEDVPSLKEYMECVDRRSEDGAWHSRPTQA